MHLCGFHKIPGSDNLDLSHSQTRCTGVHVVPQVLCIGLQGGTSDSSLWGEMLPLLLGEKEGNEGRRDLFCLYLGKCIF